MINYNNVKLFLLNAEAIQMEQMFGVIMSNLDRQTK